MMIFEKKTKQKFVRYLVLKIKHARQIIDILNKN